MAECNTRRIPKMAIPSSLVGLAHMPGGYFWRRTPENSVKAKFAEFTYQDDKRYMLVSLKLGADFERGCSRPAMRPPIPTTHHPQHIDRSPAIGTPARRGSLGALPWTAL